MSVGGSLIVPDDVDLRFLEELRRRLVRWKDRRFVIVVGGGSTSRKYMRALRKVGASSRVVSEAGIRFTRFHAWFLGQVFGSVAAMHSPKTLSELEQLVSRHRVVFVGALRFTKDQTSDGTAAQIASHFRTRFINLTNVKGLYTKDPRRFKNAKLIRSISFDGFQRMMDKFVYKPGQHFVLDQHAARIIRAHRIPTFILGRDLGNFQRLLEGKRFIGTTISSL